ALLPTALGAAPGAGLPDLLPPPLRRPLRIGPGAPPRQRSGLRAGAPLSVERAGGGPLHPWRPDVRLDLLADPVASGGGLGARALWHRPVHHRARPVLRDPMGTPPTSLRRRGHIG